MPDLLPLIGAIVFLGLANAAPTAIDKAQQDPSAAGEAKQAECINAISLFTHFAFLSKNRDDFKRGLDAFVSVGCLPVLVHCLSAKNNGGMNVEDRLDAAEALVNISLFDDKLAVLEAEALPVLEELIDPSDNELICINAIRVLENLCKNSAKARAVVNGKGIPRLVQLLRSTHPYYIQSAVIDRLRDLITISEEHKLAAFNAGALPILAKLIGPSAPTDINNDNAVLLCLNAIGALRKLCIGNDQNSARARAVVNEKAVPRVVQLIRTTQNENVGLLSAVVDSLGREANIDTSLLHNYDTIKKMVTNGALDVLLRREDKLINQILYFVISEMDPQEIKRLALMEQIEKCVAELKPSAEGNESLEKLRHLIVQILQRG